MNPSYRVGWLLFRALFATYFRWKVYNPERVPLTGPVILAANHASFLDPPLIGAGLHRPLSYLARESLFDLPFMRGLLTSWRCIPVDREGGGARGLRLIFDRLRLGNAILLFPEGTRSKDGQLQPARSGIGLTVLKSSAPVIPVRVFGTFEAFNRRHRFPRPRPVAVKYGKPLWFAGQRAALRVQGKIEAKRNYQAVAGEIMAAIAALQPWRDVETFP